MAATDIKIVDIFAPGVEEAEIARALVDAAANQGFVYIKSTDETMPKELVEQAFEISKDFFKNTPIEEKQKFTIGTNNRGWSGMLRERLDPANQHIGDTKEAYNFGEFENGKTPHELPSRFAVREAQIGDFWVQCQKVASRILYLLGLGLEAPPNLFVDSHDQSKGPSGTALRFLYYPTPTSDSPDDRGIRAGAHSDYGSITLLFRRSGQAGLERLTPEQTWVPVPVHPPTTEDDPSPPILVNIGDLLSYWTNGLLRSTVHRVTGPSESFEQTRYGGEKPGERYSIAFFKHPAHDTRLEAIPCERILNFKGGANSEGETYTDRKVVTALEHLLIRLRKLTPVFMTRLSS